MDTLSQFELAVEQLKAGNQHFEYALNNDFFDALDETEIRKGALKAVVDTRKVGGHIELHIAIDGEVTIPCNRCLDEMQQPIHTTDVWKLFFGENAATDDAIIVAADAASINIAWNLYECIALAIPIAHTHASGQCNAEMMAKFDEYAIDEQTTRIEPDPRWDALKHISTNN